MSLLCKAWCDVVSDFFSLFLLSGVVTRARHVRRRSCLLMSASGGGVWVTGVGVTSVGAMTLQWQGFAKDRARRRGFALGLGFSSRRHQGVFGVSGKTRGHTVARHS